MALPRRAEIFALPALRACSNLDRAKKIQIICDKHSRTLRPCMDNEKRKPGNNWWYLLLLVQFLGTLWVSFYNRVEPAWAGIPFFYWYQMLMVFIGAGITAIVYFATE